jgi:hypothetical protein
LQLYCIVSKLIKIENSSHNEEITKCSVGLEYSIWRMIDLLHTNSILQNESWLVYHRPTNEYKVQTQMMIAPTHPRPDERHLGTFWR